MPDDLNNQSLPQDTKDSPLSSPRGNPEEAEKYVDRLVGLINQDKLLISHTDISKVNPTALQDHYRLSLENYEVEVSHSKQPDTDKDFYIILFTNTKQVREGCAEKVILAYFYLAEEQFRKFKSTSDEQIKRRVRKLEEKKLQEAMIPIESLLDQISASDLPTVEQAATTGSGDAQVLVA